MGGSVLWADNDLSLKDGDCYFSFDEVFELIKDSGWRLPTLEEVAELDKIYDITKGDYVIAQDNDRIILANISGKVIYDFGDSKDVKGYFCEIEV